MPRDGHPRIARRYRARPVVAADRDRIDRLQRRGVGDLGRDACVRVRARRRGRQRCRRGRAARPVGFARTHRSDPRRPLPARSRAHDRLPRASGGDVRDRDRPRARRADRDRVRTRCVRGVEHDAHATCSERSAASTRIDAGRAHERECRLGRDRERGHRRRACARRRVAVGVRRRHRLRSHGRVAGRECADRDRCARTGGAAVQERRTDQRSTKCAARPRRATARAPADRASRGAAAAGRRARCAVRGARAERARHR